MEKRLYPNKHKKTNTECATCGYATSRIHTFEMLLSGNWQNENNGNFVATRSTPIRHSTLESDVLVPLAQSIVWSVVSTIPAVSISLFMRWEWSAPLFVTGVSMLASWVSAMRRSEFSQMKTEEFQYDANSETDEREGGGAERAVLTMEVVHKTSQIRSRMQLLELPEHIDEVKFSEFLKAAVAGRGLARKNWTPETKGFSRDDYDAMLEKLEQCEMVERLPSGARKMTENGKRTVKAMVRGGII